MFLNTLWWCITASLKTMNRCAKRLKARGYTFASETDTEVIAHLVHWELKQGGTLRDAVLRAIPQLRGAYGTVIMDTRHPDTLLAARSGSPLVIGLGMGENFIASDQLALLPVTRRFIFLEEGDIAEVTRRSVSIFDNTGAEVKRQDIESSLQYDAGDKGIYRHYMQKEIYEQPNAIKNTLTGRISHGEVDLSELGAESQRTAVSGGTYSDHRLRYVVQLRDGFSLLV
ncbi:Glucosamine--fructose-6-phosphateamino transferase [isomerizing] [Salmonella enterica subsp. salamae]|uniref:Glutamine--fructose-6-phosphate aminotransferase [isomerizing] n=1 Tax=Salmonella enterica subsp. salamae TaxID=59202 RepID=A0A6D2GEW8_SALER|nr:Glucosamine--fructose-6-phosphateamino transferase [isomerizing] [Salmonella enterica subsp. salamae]